MKKPSKPSEPEHVLNLPITPMLVHDPRWQVKMSDDPDPVFSFHHPESFEELHRKADEFNATMPKRRITDLTLDHGEYMIIGIALATLSEISTEQGDKISAQKIGKFAMKLQAAAEEV
jgi:hypothetical protein